MSTLLWLLGFGLMMGSFSLLFGRTEHRVRPRISVDHHAHRRQRRHKQRSGAPSGAR